MNTPNTNRVIEINARDIQGDNRKWRYALQRLISKSGGPYSILDNNLFNDTVVDGRVSLLMTSPPKTMKTANRFTYPVEDFLKGGKGDGKVGKIANFLKMGYEAINTLALGEGATSSTWQPWMTGVRAWDGSRGGFSFDYEFSFAMGQYGLWNAKEEVVKPILNLIAPALPRSMSNFSMNGPFPTAVQLLSLMVQEGLGNVANKVEGILQQTDNNPIQNTLSSTQNSLGDLWNNFTSSLDTKDASSFFNSLVKSGVDSVNDVLSTFSDALNNLIQEAYRDYTYDIKFGNFVTFYNMIITNGETSFSNEVDQFGYPIAGTVKLSFEGLVPLSMTYTSNDLVAIKYGGN